MYKYFVVSDTGKVLGEEGLIAATLEIPICIIFPSYIKFIIHMNACLHRFLVKDFHLLVKG